MKAFLILICCIFIWGCPVYDPPMGVIEIKNISDSAIYVYCTCDDNLPCEPKLLLYHSLGNNSFDAEGKKITDTLFFPNYRINAQAKGSIGVWGTPKMPRVFCDDKEIRLYFITEATMRTKDWKEICKNQMYQKKIILSQNQLDSLHWGIIFNP